MSMCSAAMQTALERGVLTDSDLPWKPSFAAQTLKNNVQAAAFQAIRSRDARALRRSLVGGL